MSASYFETCIQAQINVDRARSTEHGWSFNERGFDRFTIGDLIRAILVIDNPTDAKAFYVSYVEELNKRDDLKDPAEAIARANIGWCFGEGMARERIAMWVETTSSAHPVFGTMVEPLTPEDAFEAGRRMGEAQP